MSRGDPLRVDDYLGHLIEAIDNILEYTADMDWVAFSLDKKTQDAVIRNFEIIGEACNNVTKHHGAFSVAHPEIPWNFAYELRNALAHGSSRWINRLCGRPSVMICLGFGRLLRLRRIQSRHVSRLPESHSSRGGAVTRCCPRRRQDSV